MSTRIMSICWPLQMSPSQKAVLISLADQANDEGHCWPSLKTMSERTCLSERAVRNAIRWLEQSGYLKSCGRSGTSNYYILTPAAGAGVDGHGTPAPDAGPAANAPRHEMPDPPAPDAAPPGTRCRPPRHQVPPNRNRTVIEPSVNREEGADEQRKPKRSSQLPDDFEPNEANRRVAAEQGVSISEQLPQFSDYHRAKGSTMKDWHAALNTWLRNARKFDRSRSDRPVQETPYERGQRMARERGIIQ